jgi:hypothetical protein
MEEDIKQELEQLKEEVRQLKESQKGSTHFKDLPEEDQMKIVRLYVDHLYKSDKTEVDLEGILTEAQKTDLTDGNASTAHKHDHGGMDGLDDDDHSAIYYNKTTIDALIAPVVATLTAGESIAGTPPYYPVFIKDADNKFYLSDANDTDRLQFDGFVKGNVSADATQSVQLVGIVDGFTGLDTGKLYYVQDSIGQIGTSPGTYSILVGKAISATELLIIKSSGIGLPTTGLTFGTVYQAATSGFAIGWVADNTTNSNYAEVIGYTDNANPPTTVVAQNTSYIYICAKGPKACVTMPVKQGDYWKITKASSGIAETSSLEFIPVS